jgi:hypothetical protein
MSDDNSYGSLFHHELDYSGKWIKSIIQQISNLHCIFGEESSNNPNGIIIHNPGDIFKLDQLLGEEIAKYMVSSYITQNIKKYGDTKQEYFTVKHVINIVLYYIDPRSPTLINKKTIECIIIILNHPHFKGCKNIDDIKKNLPSINNLNDRFNGLCESSSDEEENLLGVSQKLEAIPPKVPNMFFD